MKKPKVFANTIDKKINNNQEFFESKSINHDLNENLLIKKSNSYLYDKSRDYDNLTVLEKIDKLFDGNGYVFNVNVSIATKDKKYDTKIAGKVNNHLITMDNDVINIDDIIDLQIN